MLWLVRIFIVLSFLIAKPISFVLDKCLGEEIGSIYTRTQMKAMFKKYEKENLLKAEEGKILAGALEFEAKQVNQVMTPLERSYMLEISAQLNEALLNEIYFHGFSRIPVYKGTK